MTQSPAGGSVNRPYLFQRHQCHPAFWALAWLSSHNFRMHRAGVSLFLLLLACHAGVQRRRMLVILAPTWAIGVNRPCLRARANRTDGDCGREDQNLFSHWMFDFCRGSRAGCRAEEVQTTRLPLQRNNLRSRTAIVRREKVARGRECSQSIQRMTFGRAVRYRAIAE